MITNYFLISSNSFIRASNSAIFFPIRYTICCICEHSSTFMPLRNAEAKKIREAACGNAVSPEHDSDKTLEFHGRKPVLSLPAAEETKQPTRSIDRTEKKAVQTPVSKEEIMAEETKKFTVVGDAEKDPFEEVLKSIEETRNKAREVLDMTTELTRSVKSLRGAVKARERDFRNTRDLLGKLKKVSGF